MASIKPFVAIRPNSALAAEPAYGKAQHEGRDVIGRLLQGENYTIAAYPAIYIYETDTVSGRQTGVWALTDLADYHQGSIVAHEHILPESEEDIRAYRERVGLEGAPVLLTYTDNHAIDVLIERVISSGTPEIFYDGDDTHKLWQVTLPDLIGQFEVAFKRLKVVYVADGHHRLAAAAAMHHKTQQWISTLYVAVSQLRIRAFHRLVIPGTGISADSVLNVVQQYFHVSVIPGNVAYKPDRNHRFGLFLQGTWYQLDLKALLIRLQEETDVHILQEHILEPVFGIKKPESDPRLQVFAAEEGWRGLLNTIAEDKNAVAFTLFPMTAGKLIEQADRHVALPPKSTWIEPKVPYGLLMYSNRINECSTL
jgi:uncharacterized protein (DUF1015 family)